MEACGGKVLVVDDDREFRTFMRELLELAGFATAEAADGEEAVAMARSDRPALAILDVRLPGISGYETCRRLKSALGESFPVVLVSGERTESFDRAAGLLIGADDYLAKPFSPDELIARVRRLHPGPDEARAPSASDDASLTRRELQVLRMLARGMSQGDIARELMISPKTVSSHIEQILPKLGVHSRAEAVAAAFSRGIVSVDTPKVFG
jgi:DNA-binding NarL/FixJ family response regulator